jgi:hypothetical protein
MVSSVTVASRSSRPLDRSAMERAAYGGLEGPLSPRIAGMRKQEVSGTRRASFEVSAWRGRSASGSWRVEPSPDVRS